jgi:hypothetical protein
MNAIKDRIKVYDEEIPHITDPAIKAQAVAIRAELESLEGPTVALLDRIERDMTFLPFGPGRPCSGHSGDCQWCKAWRKVRSDIEKEPVA